MSLFASPFKRLARWVLRKELSDLRMALALSEMENQMARDAGRLFVRLVIL